MALTPLDIHNKEFKRGFRGYSEVEVDEFLDEVVKEFEDLIQTKTRLEEQVSELEEKVSQYRALEETLRDALVIAQRTADEVKDAARKEAELIVREAESEKEKMLSDSEERNQLLKDEYNDLRKQIHQLKARLKGIVQSHLELVDTQINEMDNEFPGTKDADEEMDDVEDTTVFRD